MRLLNYRMVSETKMRVNNVSLTVPTWDALFFEAMSKTNSVKKRAALLNIWLDKTATLRENGFDHLEEGVAWDSMKEEFEKILNNKVS